MAVLPPASPDAAPPGLGSPPWLTASGAAVNVSGGTAATVSVSGGTTATASVSADSLEQSPLPQTAAEDSSILTLCVGCRRAVRLTDEQAVIAEAERIALDVVSLAFCRSCWCEAASTG